QTTGNWTSSDSLGSFNEGPIPVSLSNLDSGETYYYRFETNNTEYSSWSGVGTFTTLAYDQGTLRFHTGINEDGDLAGLYWDKNGSGEIKIKDANITTQNYIAPDGSSWMMSKALFHFSNDFYLGPNFSKVILEGVNGLAIHSDGNVSIAKSLTSSPILASPHIPNGTLQDGYDSYYVDDASKGLRVGRGQLGGFSGGQGPGKGNSLGNSGAGGLSGGGGSFAGEGGPGASGPSGITYGFGGLEILLGGSGGGMGNLGDAGAGGGAIEINAVGDLNIQSGVLISMNGGTVFVNPSQGAYFSGGSGSGGAIRLVGANIRNDGIIEALGGDSAGKDSREPGARFLSNAGGAGGGGRVAFISDGYIEQGVVKVDGGFGNGDAFAGFSGSVFKGSNSLGAPLDLNVSSGTLIFDTGGAWSHTSGLKGKGVVSLSYLDASGKRFGYGVCTFTFSNIFIGNEVSVVVQGDNALEFVVNGNVSIGTTISLNGKSGVQGVYSGQAGPGGWSSGRGLRNTDLFSNLHPALNGQGPGGGRGYEIGKSNGGGSYGGLGSGGLNGGVAGIIYGDEEISNLVGGSGGGHALIGSGNAGGGGGAISFKVTGTFSLEASGSISTKGGNGQPAGDGSGAGGSGGAIRIEAGSISNLGVLDSRGGDATGDTTLAGAGGGGRLSLLTSGLLTEGVVLVSGGVNQSIAFNNYRPNDLVGHWKLDENSSTNIAINSTGNTLLNGTISGSPLRIAGVKEGAFKFDGNDDRIVISNNSALELDKYTVSMWIYPEKNDEDFTGVFGRNGRNYSIWLGDSNHATRPFIHHRFGEAENVNEGIANFIVSGWNRWYHIACSNGGIGGIARTYVNGTFVINNQRYERKVLGDLIRNQTAPLNIGVDPANEGSVNQYFLGMMDDIRLYNEPLGSEDVYHLYKGDPGVIDYNAPRNEAKQAAAGSLLKVITPTLPVISPSPLTYGTEVVGLDLGHSSGLSYTLAGLPDGISNKISFLPSDLPGVIAWYRADLNNSFSYYSNLAFERNDTVATDEQILSYSFDESNESITFDETGNGYHGSLIGDVSRGGGKFNGGVHFDGTKDAIVIPKIENLDSGAAFSISLWFNRTIDIQNNPTAHSISNVLFAQSSADFNDNLEIGTSGSDVKIYLDNGVDNIFTTNDANISDNTWHHLLIAYGDELNLYLDGSPAFKSGWATSHLTGDSDSGVSNTHAYTCAVNVNGSTKTVNGVPFTGSNATSGTNWSITTGFTNLHNSNASTVTGQIGDVLGNGFRFNGDPQKIKITGLTPGENYTFALYCQAWGTTRNCILSSSALPQTITVNQDQHSSSAQDGLLVECSYCAPGTEVEFTIDPVIGNTTWHLYAFSNREGISDLVTNTTPFATSGPLISSSDSPISLGLSRPYSDQTGDYNGSIDDLRIFSRELNASEVVTLYGIGNGDFTGTTRTNIDKNRVLSWDDSSGSERHATSEKISSSPRVVIDPQTNKLMTSFDFGDTLKIEGAISMPMTIYMVGRENGISFSDREFFTRQGWRMANNGNWSLRRWDNNDPSIVSSVPSTVLSLVGWTIDRYGYELSINGSSIGTNTSGNWHPNVLFDRINQNSSLLIGDLILLPRSLSDGEKEKLEGYFAHKWNLHELLPNGHNYKNEPPLGEQGLLLSGTPKSAGNFTINVSASNLWGAVDQNFTIVVHATSPQIQTQPALQVGSSSARLQGDLLELGGEQTNVSFEYGTNNLSLDQNTTASTATSSGIVSHLLTGLNPGTTYFYRAWANNSAGSSSGNSISINPLFDWPLRSVSGNTVADLNGRAPGTLGGNVASYFDSIRGNSVRFDGVDDFITFGDLDEMDSANRFTLSLWFKKEQDLTGSSTNHGIDNVLVAQSSSSSNDNLEIGTQGSRVEIYIDSGLSGELDTAVSIDAGILVNKWHHLALVYGSEMSLFVDGTKITTWTQYNGKLDSSVNSPFTLGIARPSVNRWGEFKGLMQDVKIFDSELSPIEIGILAEVGSIQSFTTGTQPALPLVQVRPATSITESNATLHYELLSYDEAQPEIIMYWGPVDRSDNSGLWENNQSLGPQGTGEGNVTISGFQPGDTIFYRVQAKGLTYSDWSDEYGEVRTVALPAISSLPANGISPTRASLRGAVISNGGVKQISALSVPQVSNDLIAHWRFDEGSGQEAYDSTGFSTPAEIFDGVSWVEGMGGQWGKALNFDGSSLAYLKAGSFRIEGGMSFSAWVYKENLGIYQRVFDFGNGADSQNLTLSNRWKSSEVEWSVRRGANNQNLVVTNFWTLNEWQHVVGSVNESGIMKVYRNGELKGSKLGHIPTSTTRTSHLIGKSNWGSDDYFYGMMDDLRVYDRAITDDEVINIYNGDLQVEKILGGENPEVTIFWGDEDAGQTTDVNSSSSGAWDAHISLGVLALGEFSVPLSNLQTGKTYFYRIIANNAAGSTPLSEVSTFSTGSFGFKSDSFSEGEMLLWLDASDVNGDGNASNEPFGGVVDQWRDKSGANRHAGNGNGPELRVGSWNGLSTLKFDGLGNYLRVSDSSAFNVGEDMTLFVVAKGDVLNDWRPIITKRGEDDIGWQFRKGDTDFATFTIRGTSGSDGQNGGTLINGETHVWSMRKNSVKRTQWADGNLEFNIDDRGIIPSTTSDLVIGARDQNGISSFGGFEIGEILIYDKALSDSDVEKLQGHLAHKWGLSEKLPSGHTYKTSLPKFENRPEIILSDSYSIKRSASLSLQVLTNRPANNFAATGLPLGLELNSTSGLITGIPTETGSFSTKFEASNQAGTYSKDVILLVTDFTGWDYSTTISFPGYTRSTTLIDFPVFIEFNSSLSGFSYDQFASPYGYDLRFLGNNGSEELKYEPVTWNVQGTSGFWVLLSSFDENSTIKAVWGNPNAIQQPNYCKDGSVWSNYNVVWHMDGTSSNILKESRISAHATPYNFDQLRVPGIIGTALSFDGVNDYVDLPLSVHPKSENHQLTISFWSYGGPSLSASKNTTLFESGSALGRSLNLHFPYNSKLQWEGGSDNSYDNINKDFSAYKGRWDYWVLQKDVDSGSMYVYRNGQLWHDGYNRTRPFGETVESFRLGANRNAGWHWNGWLDELRMSFTLESPDSILASYESQRPDGNFYSSQPVVGPPLFIDGQVAEGYANDSNLSYLIKVFPSAVSFSAVGLPAGILLNSSTGEISGVPLQGGTYNVTITASNSSGQDQGVLVLSIVERSGFTHDVEFDCSAYSGTTLHDFPLLIRLDRSVNNFSLKSFASAKCYDLRFYDQQARELEYEIDEINDSNGSVDAWVKVKDFNSSTVISAYWGNPNLALTPPVYCNDGSTWSNGFRGVWHLRTIDEVKVLTDSSLYRNHASDEFGFGDSGIVGSGRTLAGGVEKFLRVPSAYSVDDLHEKSYTFSSWIRLGESPPSKAENSVYGSGFLTNPNNSYFDDINNLISLKPNGSRIMQAGPRQGLYFDGDNDFKNGGIGINRNDSYMTLFQAMFTPQETGNYQFRCDRKDDYATIWLDLNRNGTFEQNGVEKLGGNDNFTSDPISLSAGVDYKISIAHGEGWGGSRIKPWIKTPSADWQIIDPSDPAQVNMFSVTFDGNISDEISPYIIAKHGVAERIVLRDGKAAVFHDLESNSSAISPNTFDYGTWKHFAVTVDHQLGQMKVFEDGNQTQSTSFTPGGTAQSVVAQDWFFGQGLVSSSFDEMRLSKTSRSADWVNASYLNQKPNGTLPSISAVTGLPSFTSVSTFNLSADQPFNHNITVTGTYLVYTAVGLPSGILLSSSDGNLSGSPSVSGQFTSTISALYPNGNRADQQYLFTISPSAPDILLSAPQVVNSTSLSISYELNSTGGEDPDVYVLADTVDQGTNFYAWTYRLALGKKGLGEGSTILGGLAPDQRYYIRLYAENSAGFDWTGKKFLVRTQPLIQHLPATLGIWFDATDISGNG
ncbi:MAG: putative Ig domain-containing protein, partial [Opitutales bacterium]|nr:putative Ig domain-containing protein [Opitutales bacterium]